MNETNEPCGVITSDELDALERRILAEVSAGVKDDKVRGLMEKFAERSSQLRIQLVRVESDARRKMAFGE